MTNHTRRTEGLVEIDGTGYYAVPGIDRMPPFFMSVVSDGDRWMFISSSGALSAGRRDVSGAVFPYETDDRLHLAEGRTGPVTAIRAGDRLWTPFRGLTTSATRRNLFKSVVGDTIVFQEFDDDLGLEFRYRWSSCDEFGFVRRATLVNHSDAPVTVSVIDGLVNILPYGLSPTLYDGLSNLTNAYKRSEVTNDRLAIFSLEAGVVDRPEPAETLRATTVWSLGFHDASLTLDSAALRTFERGDDIGTRTLLTGVPGAYLLNGTVTLEPGADASWRFAVDGAQDQVAVAGLLAHLRAAGDLDGEIDSALDTATRRLEGIMAPADAMQRTGDRVATAHHFSNTTYNVMRGGVPLDGYVISGPLFVDFLRNRNTAVAAAHGEWLAALPETIERSELLERAEATGDPHLTRIAAEYLPFSFSRRHGDPSRPWNAFSIRIRDDEGEPIIYYEGNWRDIFQNWEALAMSYPDYLPGMISVFVNASTPDGFNPYRITSHGIDWEAPDPHDPWSNIGYWGDHQIVYLLRLLEGAERHRPDVMESLLADARFTYANVPYRIATYPDLIDDPKSTIEYDEAAAARIDRAVGELGADARLVQGDDGQIHVVTFLEKLLVPVLSKLSNYVPGGGIWMNTQRPEWNDANNALVGYGLSMVTLYQLRRYLDHLRTTIRSSDLDEVPMSTEVASWLSAVADVLDSVDPGDSLTPRVRKQLLDGVGTAFSDYRLKVYDSGFSGMIPVAVATIAALCDRAIEHLDTTIRANRRDDGLYHSYNLIEFSTDRSEARVRHLYEMLEGQVAVIASGVLSPDEQADVVDALFSSAMYREDADSFMLYPARRLPSFLEKNIVPGDAVDGNPLLTELLSAGDRSVIATDVDGRHRFDASFTNKDQLLAELDRLSGDPRWSELVAQHGPAVVEVYEQVFDHHAFTGRSGTMYGYEGIGSIYWHMVAKLLLAVQEAAVAAADGGAAPETLERLVDAYWRVRAGLGYNKTVSQFGAIPIDPYSHTPGHAGAQQPGMTGLVKEELLTRPAEVGVRVVDGEIRFDPLFVRDSELLDHEEPWPLIALTGEEKSIGVPAASLGMTICQVPVLVTASDGDARVEIVRVDGTTETIPGPGLGTDASGEIFGRNGTIALVHAYLPG